MVGIIVQVLREMYPNSAFFSACEPDVPCITPGTYAFLGAGAALSGIMHITVSVVVIMFELTGALTYILPTMVSDFSHGNAHTLTTFRLWSASQKRSVTVSAMVGSLIE